MSVLKGNISSVLRRADTSLLDKIRLGNAAQNKLRDEQVATFKGALTDLGTSADERVALDIEQAGSADEVQDILGNVGGLADKGLAATLAGKKKTTLLDNVKTEMANEDLLRTYKNRKASEGQFADLAGLTPGTPQYKQKVEEYMQFNRVNSIDNPKMISEYGNEFNLADIGVSQETIQAALGEGVDITNPDNFTTNAYNTAAKNISNTLGAQWTGIRDKSKLDAKAKALLDKSEWGQAFSKRMKYEAGRTVQQDRLQAHSASIGEAINLKDTDLVDERVNNFLTFAKQQNITGDALKPFDESVNLALERTFVNPLAEFKKINPTSEYLTKKANIITPVEAKKLENGLKEIYRDKYPNLSDRYLLPRIQQDLKKDGTLAFAMQRGKELFKFGSKLESQEMMKAADYKGKQTDILNNMKLVGRDNYIVGRLEENLSKFMVPGSNDYLKVKAQGHALIRRVKNIFTLKKGPKKGTFLYDKGPGAEAFNLTLNRMILGGGAIRKDWASPNDLVLASISTKTDAPKLTDQQLMKAFVDNMPSSAKALKQIDYGDGRKVNVQQSITFLKQVMEETNKEVQARGIKDPVDLIMRIGQQVAKEKGLVNKLKNLGEISGDDIQFRKPAYE